MAAKKTKQQRIRSIIARLLKRFEPDDVLWEMSVLFEGMVVVSPTEAEADYWYKLQRACNNLASGAEKWKAEMLEDLEEEKEENEDEE